MMIGGVKASEVRAFLLGVAVATVVLVCVADLAHAEPAGAPVPGGAFLARRLAVAAAEGRVDSVPEVPVSPSTSMPKWMTVPIIAFLVLLSGLFSGLTLGLMGLDLNGLQIVEKGGNEEEARCAARIRPLRQNGNLLLCTLLLGNVAVNSALSILVANIASGLVGFLVSTPMIVIFGEIIPQAVCSRYALQIGARTVPVVKFVIAIFYVLTKPMSMILDCMLGHEIGTVMSANEIIELLKLQVSLGAVNKEFGELAKQVTEGSLSFRDKHAEQIMTPLEKAYMLPSDTRLGYSTIREIFETGFSRVPVYGKHRHDVVGLLCTKDLMLADPEDEMRLDDFIAIFNRKVNTYAPDTKLMDALNAFKQGGTHIGLVQAATKDEKGVSAHCETLGVLTLEDIVEEIIQAEIVDETDVYVDVDNSIRVGDGRDAVRLNLGIFDPVWKNTQQDHLSRDEISAAAAHLHRAFLAPHLSMQAVELLVANAEVRTQRRMTKLDVADVAEEDWLYKGGSPADHCTLVLQGRVGVTAGREGFRSEAGAFSILAKEAFFTQGTYVPDFSAQVSTSEVRILVIPRSQYAYALRLNSDKDALCASADEALRLPRRVRADSSFSVVCQPSWPCTDASVEETCKTPTRIGSSLPTELTESGCSSTWPTQDTLPRSASM